MAQHLCKVAEKSDTNKMDLRNLAIVFGPTLVRASDDNMMSMVTDMSDQCKIVESILSNCEWFFKGDDGEDCGIPIVIPEDNMDFEGSIPSILQSNVLSNAPDTQELLRQNLQKLEKAGHLPPSSGGLGGLASPSKEVSAKDIVSGIISAAKRKKEKGGSKKDSLDSGDASKASQKHEIESIKSQSVPPTHPINKNRRNSESVLQSAMAIAAAVPQLVVGSTPHGSIQHHHLAASSGQHQLHPSQNVTQSGSTQHHSSSASQVASISSATVKSAESQYHHTMAQSSFNSAIAATTNIGGDGHKMHLHDIADVADASNFPIETYQGLEEATAERIKRFEDETKAMLMRSTGSRSDLSPATPEMGRTTSGKGLAKYYGNIMIKFMK